LDGREGLKVKVGAKEVVAASQPQGSMIVHLDHAVIKVKVLPNPLGDAVLILYSRTFQG
jgi:hypothetical protein